MTVWIVTEEWTSERTLRDNFEIVGIYSTEEKARAVQEEMIDQNAIDVLYVGLAEKDYVLYEYEVE